MITTKKESKWVNPHLIQRLRKPSELTNPFAFGGGLSDGGISKDAMKLLVPIMSFDYMGSAEFEWGAVPKAFSNLVKLKKDLVCGELKINISAKRFNWEEKTTNKIEMSKIPIFYICPKHLEINVKDYIKQTAKDKTIILKEITMFVDSIINETNIYGWLELDNPFMFFRNNQMYISVCKLFGLKEK